MNFQMKNATTPITATPPATLIPMIEPVPSPLSLLSSEVDDSDALDDVAEPVWSGAETKTVVITTEPFASVVEMTLLVSSGGF